MARVVFNRGHADHKHAALTTRPRADKLSTYVDSITNFVYHNKIIKYFGCLILTMRFSHLVMAANA